MNFRSVVLRRAQESSDSTCILLLFMILFWKGQWKMKRLCWSLPLKWGLAGARASCSQRACVLLKKGRCCVTSVQSFKDFLHLQLEHEVWNQGRAGIRCPLHCRRQLWQWICRWCWRWFEMPIGEGIWCVKAVLEPWWPKKTGNVRFRDGGEIFIRSTQLKKAEGEALCTTAFLDGQEQRTAPHRI